MIHASLYDVPLDRCAAVIAMGEGLNYVAGFEPPPPAAELFTRIAAALDPGGLLLFDVMVRGRETATPYRTWLLGSDWATLVEVVPHPAEHGLSRAITTFRLVDGAYRRGYEEHRVHLFSQSRLVEELEQAGFRVRTSRAYGPVALGPGRRLFLCRKARAGAES